MAATDTIAQAWQEFERESRLDLQPDATREAMREVFYSGFSSAVGVVIHAASKTISDTEGAQVLNGLIAEIAAFSVQLAARKS